MSGEKLEDARIILNLLESVERDSAQTQRRLAAEFGVALGLVNSYLKRCVRKGLVKMREAPARRYSYYLTPSGFAEKSRLTVEYLTYSLSFFRLAREHCRVALEIAGQRGWSRIALAGISDLAEISSICALEAGITIVAVIDPEGQRPTFVGAPVFATFKAATEKFDGVLVTNLLRAQETYRDAVENCGSDYVLVPQLLGARQNEAVA